MQINLYRKNPAFLRDASDAGAAPSLGISWVWKASRSTHPGSSSLYWQQFGH